MHRFGSALTGQMGWVVTGTSCLANIILEVLLCLEAQLSVRPEEQIPNTLAPLCKALPQMLPPSGGGRSSASLLGPGLGELPSEARCSAVSASMWVLVVLLDQNEKNLLSNKQA